MLVLSRFVITLIKCLKGHKSLGSLCNVKSKSDSVSQWLSQWQGHLLSCCGQLKIQKRSSPNRDNTVSAGKIKITTLLILILSSLQLYLVGVLQFSIWKQKCERSQMIISIHYPPLQTARQTKASNSEYKEGKFWTLVPLLAEGRRAQPRFEWGVELSHMHWY